MSHFLMFHGLGMFTFGPPFEAARLPLAPAFEMLIVGGVVMVFLLALAAGATFMPPAAV